MKLWYGFGSEHSAKLIMIGRFQTDEEAEAALSDFRGLNDIIGETFDYDSFDKNPWLWYRQSKLREYLERLGIYYLSPDDLEQFVRDHEVERKCRQVSIRTDEDDVNGFLKFLIHKGAHVEVYSAHHFPDGSPVKDLRPER